MNLFCIPIASTTSITIYCTISITFSICYHLITNRRENNRKIIP
nr:MAG TPA: hypothetical protein [Caudoviricetes sp.]